MLKIYNVNQLSEEDFNKLCSELPATRLEKLNQKVSLNDKKLCAVEYFIVKKLLKLKKNLEFCYNQNGKPYIPGKKHFNIAHCDDVLCVCASKNPIGVDVQKIVYDKNLANLICLEEEYKSINKAKNKAKAFTTLVTQKESAIKCLGLNLTYVKNILSTHKFKFKSKKYKDFIITSCKLI